MTRTTTQVLQSHLSKRLAGDTESDIAENFDPEIVLLSSFGVFFGHDGIRRSAELLFEKLGPSMFEYRHTLIEGEYGFLEWTAHSDNKVITDGADSFHIVDGFVRMQTVHYTTVDR